MRSWWTRWRALLLRKESGTTLALYRMALGLCAIYTLGSVVNRGLVPVLWMDVKDGGYLHMGPKTWWLIDLLGGPSPQVVWGLVALTTTASAALVLGLGGRVPAFLVLQGFLALTWLNGAAGGSYDDLITNGLWLAVLGETTATLSLDARLRTGSWRSERLVSAWPRYLIIGQIVVVYFSTALQKLSAYWTPGGDFSALYYILQQPTWQRIDMRWVAHVFPLTQLMTASTWFWELSSPLLLLAFRYRDARTGAGRLRAVMNRMDFRLWWISFGTLLHLGIFALMEVGPFTWITLSYYLALIHPDEWARLGRGSRPRVRAAPIPRAG